MFNNKLYSDVKFVVRGDHGESESKQVIPQAPQAQNTWCMRQLVYTVNCMGKSPILKKIV